MDREEMMYVDGGLSTNALACMIDLGLIIVCGAINAGLRSAGFFGKGAAKNYIKKNAPKWAKTLYKFTQTFEAITGIGGIGGLIGGALSDINIWIDKISSFFSIGGIIASILDIADGSWDGLISF